MISHTKSSCSHLLRGKQRFLRYVYTDITDILMSERLSASTFRCNK